jgi:hypothetical protein
MKAINIYEYTRIMYVSPSFCYFLSPRSTYSHQHFVYKFPQSMYFLYYYRTTFTLTEKKTAKCIVLYVFILKFFNRKRTK